MGLHRNAVVTCAALAVLLPAAAGCVGGIGTQRVAGTPHPAGSAGPAGSNGPDGSTGPQPSATGELPAATGDDAILARVGLRQSELPPGDTLTLMPDGDQVDGQVTLDLCGASFPSERRRTARLQHIAVDVDGRTVVSDENVAYDSPAGASQALSELRHAVAACPKNRLVPSRASGVPPMRYVFLPVPQTMLAHLAADRAVVDMVTTTQDGRTRHAVELYQRRGRILVVAYGSDINTVVNYGQTLRVHLDALPASDVGG